MRQGSGHTGLGFNDAGPVPSFPLNFSVTLDQSLNLCEPQFLHLQNVNTTICSPQLSELGGFYQVCV